MICCEHEEDNIEKKNKKRIQFSPEQRKSITHEM